MTWKTKLSQVLNTLTHYILRYEGGWVEDHRNGHGIYYYVNGDTYDGNWYEHKRHGQGVYTYHTSGTKCKGTWVQGKREGDGELIHSNHRYVGCFVSGNLKGPGKYSFDVGCEQYGEYILHETTTEGETEEDEHLTTITPKWICKRIVDIDSMGR